MTIPQKPLKNANYKPKKKKSKNT